MSLTLFEFTVFGLHLALITITIILIQVYNAGGMIREMMTIEDKGQPFVERPFESPDSDSESESVKKPFNPEQETYTMTENPMLRHRSLQKEPDASPAVEMVD